MRRQPLLAPVLIAVLVGALTGACVLDPDRADPVLAPDGLATTTVERATTSPTLPPSVTPSSGVPVSPSTGAGQVPSVGADSLGAGAGFRCRQVDVVTSGRVARVDLIETSGLVASTRHDAIVWAHNDSGQAPGLYAVDLDGRDRGFFVLTRDGAAVAASDIEDVAVVDGTIYLADVGDNGASRPFVTVFMVAEPVPGARGGGADGTAEVIGRFDLRYPDGPTDVEAVLVDPVTGDLYLFSKDLDAPTEPTRIYVVPASSIDRAVAGGEPVEASLVGSIDVAALTAASSSFALGTVLYPGSVTAADITGDGGLIALRTYGSVWLFDRAGGQSVAEALAGPTCEGGAARETQGESVAFLPTDPGDQVVAYVTSSEGEGQAIHVVRVEIAR